MNRLLDSASASVWQRCNRLDKESFATQLHAVYPGEWRATFPPAIYPPGFLSQLGETAAALLALVFSLPERLFNGDIKSQLVAQRLTADQQAAVLPFCTPALLAKARLFARPDILLTHGEPQVVEMNITPSLGGLGICDRYVHTWRQSALSRALAEEGIVLEAPPMGQIWGEVLHRHRTARGATPPVMLELIDDPAENPEANFARPDFLWVAQQAGFEVITARAPDVRFTPGGVYVGQQKIDVVFTDFVLAEQLEHGISSDFFTRLVDAEALGQLDVFSIPASCALYDNKANLALLSDPVYGAKFSATERALIARHIPPTFLLSEETLARARRERAQLVLKPGLGLCGHRIVFGYACTDQEWQAELEAQLAAGGSWILQTLVSDLWSYTPPGSASEPRMVCLGPLIFDGQYAGIFSREEAFSGKAVAVNRAQGASWTAGFERSAGSI